MQTPTLHQMDNPCRFSVADIVNILTTSLITKSSASFDFLTSIGLEKTARTISITIKERLSYSNRTCVSSCLLHIYHQKKTCKEAYFFFLKKIHMITDFFLKQKKPNPRIISKEKKQHATITQISNIISACSAPSSANHFATFPD